MEGEDVSRGLHRLESQSGGVVGVGLWSTFRTPVRPESFTKGDWDRRGTSCDPQGPFDGGQ